MNPILRSVLAAMLAAVSGIAFHTLLAAGFMIQFSMIPWDRSIEFSATLSATRNAMFFCSLVVDAIVGCVYVLASSRRSRISTMAGAIGAAISSELARISLAGIAMCLIVIAGLYQFSVLGDRQLSPADLLANPTLRLLNVAGDSAVVYVMGLNWFFVTMTVAALSRVIWVKLLRLARKSI